MTVHHIHSTPDQVPADIAVNVQGSLVMLLVDPETAEQLAAGIRLAGEMKARGAEHRPHLLTEVDALEQAATLARLSEGLHRLDAAIAALPPNVTPLIPLGVGS